MSAEICLFIFSNFLSNYYNEKKLITLSLGFVLRLNNDMRPKCIMISNNTISMVNDMI